MHYDVGRKRDKGQSGKYGIPVNREEGKTRESEEITDLG